MKALVVHESMFGNTDAIAEAIVRGLEQEDFTVTSRDVGQAPSLADVDVDLLVVGGPTHAFSMTRPRTRADAVRQGAPAERAGTGIREWLDAQERVGAGSGSGPRTGARSPLAAVFDTRASKVRRLPKTAGTRGGHVLKRLGYTLVERPMGFLVEDVAGPLVEGETDRATAWAHQLAEDCRRGLAERV
jgi:hypothetical protein